MIDRCRWHLCRGAMLAAGLVVCGLSGMAVADTVQIVADRDNTLVESPTGFWSGGIMPFLFAGNTNQDNDQDTRRSLLRFDVSSHIPLGSTITSVSVRLQMSKSVLAGTGAFTLHRVIAAWGEGTTDGAGGNGGPSSPGSATWLHRFYPDILWNSAGGDFHASASASQSVAGVGAYTWSSSGLVDDVLSWLSAPASNHGWLLKGNESIAVSAKRFDSRETAVQAQKPTLIVVFTPPSVIGGCCLGSNICVQASESACVAAGGTYRGDAVPCKPGGVCCLEDVNNDGSIGVSDLLAVIGSWGPCPAPPAACPTDFTGDHTVSVGDLLAVIGAWGPCS